MRKLVILLTVCCLSAVLCFTGAAFAEQPEAETPFGQTLEVNANHFSQAPTAANRYRFTIQTSQDYSASGGGVYLYFAVRAGEEVKSTWNACGTGGFGVLAYASGSYWVYSGATNTPIGSGAFEGMESGIFDGQPHTVEIRLNDALKLATLILDGDEISKSYTFRVPDLAASGYCAVQAPYGLATATVTGYTADYVQTFAPGEDWIAGEPVIWDNQTDLDESTLNGGYVQLDNLRADAAATFRIRSVTEDSETAAYRTDYRENRIHFEAGWSEPGEGSYWYFVFRAANPGGDMWEPAGEGGILLYGTPDGNVLLRDQAKGNAADATLAMGWAAGEIHSVDLEIDDEQGKVICVFDAGTEGEQTLTLENAAIPEAGGYKFMANQMNIQVREFAAFLQTDEEIVLESVELSQTEATLEPGGSLTLTAVQRPSGAADTLIWSSSAPEVAEVENGRVTAIAEGEADITVASQQNPQISATCRVRVVLPTPPEGMPEYEEGYLTDFSFGCDPSVAGSVTLDGAARSIVIDRQEGTLVFTADGSNQIVSDRRDNVLSFAVRIASSYQNDWIAAVSFRTSTPGNLFYSTGDGFEIIIYHNSVLIRAKGDANAAASTSGLALANLSASVADGLTHYFTIEVNDQAGTVSVWLDGEQVVAEVEFGRALAEGSELLSGGGISFASQQGKAEFTEIRTYNTNAKLPSELSFNQASYEVEEGHSLLLGNEIAIEELIDQTASWSVSDPTVASLAADGKLTGLKAGTVTVTVTFADGTEKTCQVTVKAGAPEDSSSGGGTTEPGSSCASCGSASLGGGSLLAALLLAGFGAAALRRKKD